MKIIENVSPAEAWDKLAPKYSYLNTFPDARKCLKLVEQGSEFIPSPEFPIHFVNINQLKEQQNPETGFAISMGTETASDGLIIMNHEDQAEHSGGVSGAKYYQGQLLTRDGKTIHLFSKFAEANDRGFDALKKEIESYKTLEDYNDGKPDFICPFFIPESGDEIIMVNLKDLGYSQIGFHEDCYDRETISKLPINFKRILFMRILEKSSKFFYTFLKARKVPYDILISGKGIFVKPEANGRTDFDIILTDFGGLKDEDSPINISAEFTESMLKGEVNACLLDFFSFTSVDRHNRTITITDPVLAEITDEKFTNTNLSEALTSSYQKKEIPDRNSLFVIWSMLYDAVNNSTLRGNLAKEVEVEPLSVDHLLRLIAENPLDAFRSAFLMKIAARTGLSYKEVVGRLFNINMDSQQ